MKRRASRRRRRSATLMTLGARAKRASYFFSISSNRYPSGSRSGTHFVRDTCPTMSRENVEIARGVFDAWKAGDMEAVRDLYDPDVIVRPLEGWPEPGPLVGRD